MKQQGTDRKIAAIVNVHSSVDIITNSSTEMFCVLKGESKKAVEKVLHAILNECGCEVLEMEVDQYEKWDEEKDEDVIMEGQFIITYEQHAPPCKMIMKRLKEVFEVIEE